jgi:hypothetical protein
LLGNETSEFSDQTEKLLLVAWIFAYALDKNPDSHFIPSFHIQSAA